MLSGIEGVSPAKQYLSPGRLNPTTPQVLTLEREQELLLLLLRLYAVSHGLVAPYSLARHFVVVEILWALLASGSF